MLLDVQRKGRATNTPERFGKALELDPDDELALFGTSVCHALDISSRKAHGEAIDLRRLRLARRLCRKGRRLYPNNARFAEVLGVLADSEGHHEVAQHWFRKAGALAEPHDFSWHLSLATSFAMIGDHEAELRELDEALRMGADVWIADFYRGRTLCSVGRYSEAVASLNRAMEHRGYHPEIALWLHLARVCQCQFFRAAFYRVTSNVTLFATEPRNALRMLPATGIFTFAVSWNMATRAVFFSFAAILPNRRLLYKMFRPESVYKVMSYEFCVAGKFKAAEDVCREGLKSLPDCIELISNLAIALVSQGRKEDAVAELDKALLLAPDNPVLLWNREQILTQAKLRIRPIGRLDDVQAPI